ncbi:S1C family serine protease [Deinococcus ruber]|uniref:Serine protease n=1 Tax=Deinococcus ruber TaxID=1848197 RepID=A0A918F530_9DEIO|nr:S1C family serine protease [Deinococcus ruber]GGR01696.1 serine protease [Deinococcus ruber]
MNALRARWPLRLLSVALLLSSASAQNVSAQSSKTHPATAAPQAATTPTISPQLSAVFQKNRAAALRIEDCPSKAEDPTCADPNGIGSGVLISSGGEVLTAYHVVYGSTRLEAVTLDKKRYPLTVVGFDDQHDLALLKINIAGAPFVPISSQPPRVGQAALAIGNAGGQFLKAKSGKLLALDAEAGLASFPPGTLKLDAPLAPGDSGGPVLNAQGQLIGITSYIRYQPADSASSGSKSEASQATASLDDLQLTSYAVPVTEGSALLAQLRGGLKREAPVVGLGADGLPEDGLPIQFFHDLGLGNTIGFAFTSVVRGGPADLAGLRPLGHVTYDANNVPNHATGDVITAVEGKPVTSFLDFLSAIRAHQVGEKVTLTVVRDGGATPLKIPVTLAPRSILLAGNN